MLRTVLIVVAVAVLVGAGVLASIRTNRFGVQEDLRAAGEKLQAVPRTVGPWESTQDLELDSKVKERTECEAYLYRNYQNRDTKAQVCVLMLCGEPGPMGAHTPDICYAGSGYDTKAPKLVRSVPMPDGQVSNYYTAKFRKPGESLQVCWAWGVDGKWEAAEEARGEYALRAALYKIYVSRPLTATGEAAGGSDPVHDFMTVFLPEVKRTLTPQ